MEMNSIYLQMPPERPLGKSTMIRLWEEFHCYVAPDWGEQHFERNQSSNFAVEEENLKFGCIDTFDTEHGLFDNPPNDEDNELGDLYNSLYDHSFLDTDTDNSFYHKNENDLKILTNATQDPWYCSTTSHSQGDSFYNTDCLNIPFYDTFTEEESLGTCLLEGSFAPRPSVFVTVETDEHVVPECDFAIDTSINSDDEPLQEVPEFLEFDGNVCGLKTTSNLLISTAEVLFPDYTENDAEHDSCVPVYNPDIIPVAFNSSNCEEENMILSPHSDSEEVSSGSQSTIPDYLLDNSQDIDTFLFEELSSDEDDSVEFNRPVNSCSSGDHTVPRWSIEE